MNTITNKIDIIIPVYNNIELTLQCIKSVYNNLANNINQIIIHDDCSDQNTQTNLNALKTSGYNNLKIIRSDKNIGFAAGVNKAAKSASSDYLFILNSDTEILADIITPMLTILTNNSNLAAINPSGPVYKSKKLQRCQYQLADNKLKYINSANISGYALLIKRNIFQQLGGFNTIYGRGYYEDTELSRVLINNNYQMAIYTTNKITHVGQSSFKQLKPNNKKTNNFAKELINKNKQLYLSRYPKAKQKLEIKRIYADFNKFSDPLKQQITEIILDGGEVIIHSLFTPKNLPFFQIKFKRLGLKQIF